MASRADGSLVKASHLKENKKTTDSHNRTRILLKERREKRELVLALMRRGEKICLTNMSLKEDVW